MQFFLVINLETLAQGYLKHPPASHCLAAGAVRTGNKLADSAADLLPASVPRGAAKIGVVGVGGLLAFWLLQKVWSLGSMAVSSILEHASCDLRVLLSLQ